MRAYFDDIADFLAAALQDGEQFKCWLAAESSDFVRFNRSAIRQSGHVRQIMLRLDLMHERRHAGCELALSGRLEQDRAALEGAIARLRHRIAGLPEDPHLLVSTEVRSTRHVVPSRLPETGGMVEDILAAAQGTDMVGFLASGPVYRGFANSLGQRNWHEASSFNVDWSLYLRRDKAVKSVYAGFDWDSGAFREKFRNAAGQLHMLGRDPVMVRPGTYRAYLAPAALNELIAMLNWEGFSEKSLRTRQSSLRRMHDGEVVLSPMISLSENTAEGLAPGFQPDGFIKPPRIALFEAGRLAGSMISPRTAKEYGIATNGADPNEAMTSIDLAAGSLPMGRVLQELGTGIYIGNLWYLNFSDRANCRITGMTRFATFWVENGGIKAPLDVMRFDDSLFRLLGDKLVALTQERELIADSDTYGSRSTASARLPGALLGGLNFVL